MLVPVVPLCPRLQDPGPLVTLAVLLTLVDPGVEKASDNVSLAIITLSDAC